MGYWDVSLIAADTDMANRVTAAVALEGDTENPYAVWSANNWYFAAQPGWGDAWASALAAHPDDPTYQPGRDPGVITDGQILSALQALPEEPEVPDEEEGTP